MYDKIVNPHTRRHVKVNSLLGGKIIQNYVNAALYHGGVQIPLGIQWADSEESELIIPEEYQTILEMLEFLADKEIIKKCWPKVQSMLLKYRVKNSSQSGFLRRAGVGVHRLRNDLDESFKPTQKLRNIVEKLRKNEPLSEQEELDFRTFYTFRTIYTNMLPIQNAMTREEMLGYLADVFYITPWPDSYHELLDSITRLAIKKIRQGRTGYLPRELSPAATAPQSKETVDQNAIMAALSGFVGQSLGRAGHVEV